MVDFSREVHSANSEVQHHGILRSRMERGSASSSNHWRVTCQQHVMPCFPKSPQSRRNLKPRVRRQDPEKVIVFLLNQYPLKDPGFITRVYTVWLCLVGTRTSLMGMASVCHVGNCAFLGLILSRLVLGPSDCLSLDFNTSKHKCPEEVQLSKHMDHFNFSPLVAA